MRRFMMASEDGSERVPNQPRLMRRFRSIPFMPSPVDSNEVTHAPETLKRRAPHSNYSDLSCIPFSERAPKRVCSRPESWLQKGSKTSGEDVRENVPFDPVSVEDRLYGLSTPPGSDSEEDNNSRISPVVRLLRRSTTSPISPPVSDCEEEARDVCQVTLDEDDDSDGSLRFPLSPRYLKPLVSSTSAGAWTFDQSPSLKRHNIARLKVTPDQALDRYIPKFRQRNAESQAIHISRAPSDMTPTERLLRNSSASPDPFGSILNARTRPSAIGTVPHRENVSDRRSRTRAVGNGSLTAILQARQETPPRQVSAGAIWNVGGGQVVAPSGPVRAISDGRGHFVSSGSNAPLYTARFLEGAETKEGRETHSDRIAAALNIDRNLRILDVTGSINQHRSASTGSIGLPTSGDLAPYGSRIRWIDGEWTRVGDTVLDAPSLRDDYYCTILAYSAVSKTLAVGLANRVYLWSEASGVHYPPLEDTVRASTYVTSLSFSSTAGRRNILAMGRNSGLLSLWSMEDGGEVRFKTRHTVPVSCVSFKPVTTRRPSEKFGCDTPVEELLVGDETGQIYYYSVEWLTRDQVDIHGWLGCFKLLAKISIHSQQICGLVWSPDGKEFATGANDNACCLFEVEEVLKHTSNASKTFPASRQASRDLIAHRRSSQNQYGTEVRRDDHANVSFSTEHALDLTFPPHDEIVSRVTPEQQRSLLVGLGRQKHKWVHSAAVKAIAFCPWQRGLIATGGGSNDRAIHFFHTNSGACLATINVYAQVTSLIWSTTRREIAATFGYAQPEHPYRIAVFSWPQCQQVVAIPWSSEMRALLAIPYPGGPGETQSRTTMGEQWYSRTAEEGCIVVACSDESVKFQEIWQGSSQMIRGHVGQLGGSAILESLEGIEDEGREIIR